MHERDAVIHDAVRANAPTTVGGAVLGFAEHVDARFARSRRITCSAGETTRDPRYGKDNAQMVIKFVRTKSTSHYFVQTFLGSSWAPTPTEKNANTMPCTKDVVQTSLDASRSAARRGERWV